MLRAFTGPTPNHGVCILNALSVRVLQQQKEEDPSQWMWGTLYIVVHEAQHLPGDPTLVGVSANSEAVLDSMLMTMLCL